MTTHHGWFLQSPKAMWSIVVKIIHVHLSEGSFIKKNIKKNQELITQ